MADKDGENRNGATPNSYKMKDLSGKAEVDEGVDAKKEKEEKTPMVGLLEVFRFANGGDKLMMFVGSLFACGNGALQPLLLVVYGAMIDFMVSVVIIQNYVASITEYLDDRGFEQGDFMADTTKLNQAMCDDIVAFYQNSGNFSGNSVGNFSGNFSGIFSGNFSGNTIGNSSVHYNCTALVSKTIMDMMTEFAVYYCILGGAMLICAYVQLSLWLTVAERQVKRIRHACLMNILRQNIGWFDTHQAAELNTKLSDDVLKIQEGIGDKVGAFFQWTAGALTGFGIGFYYGWKLSLVIVAISPAIAFAASIMSRLSSAVTLKEQEAYGKAGGVAEEVFSSIRTVVAFGGQEKEARRYNTSLEVARRLGVKKGFAAGMSLGLTWLILFSSWGLGFWYGGKLHRDEGFEVGNLTTVFFSMLIGAFSLGNAPPSIQAMAAARGAAYGIFKLIDLKSQIDSSSNKGEKPAKVTGLVQLKNVHFSYPARPDVKVLSGVSLDVLPGQTVALVGTSGCGKTTVVQLLMRFYDIQGGQILVDGKDIKSLNIKWLRKRIGLVSQEPVLFATTIAENIQYGRQGVRMEEIVEAAKKANAYNFIMELPEKFNTLVGERGAQLSGGQKQRIAIARALVRDPKILLLDEATSALDTESEAIVQDALDKARQGRTTLVIAHRLSTIKTADIIIGIDQGQVKEMGSPQDLMALKGIYYTLSMNQMRAAEQEQDIDSDVLQIQDKPEIGKNASPGKSLKTNDATVKDKEDETEADEDEDLPDAPFGRLIRMNAPEACYILLGCLGSVVNGCLWPGLAIILTKVIYVFAEDEDTQKTNVVIYSLLFVGLGVLSFIANFLQGYMFACSGEALTLRIRDLTFRSMMRQEIAWFDDVRNGVGALTTRLSTDASQVQGVTGHRLGSLFMSLANVAAALGIAFYHGWKMTLVVIGFLPLIALGSFIQIKLMAGQSGKNKEALEEAGKITVESIGSIRTVASLSQEQTFVNKYMANIRVPFKSALRSAHTGALLYGFSQSVMFFSYAASFVFGGYLVEDGQMDFENVFLTFGAIIYGAVGLGNASAFAPDLGKAQTSARRILQILDSKPTIDHTNADGIKLPPIYEATLAFKNVQFSYASRADVPVLQGLDIAVSPGQTLALVGSSGCGKTTTVQLIERFYDCVKGAVFLGDFDIKSLNIQWLRSQLGLVSQEPVLFDTSIGQNIAYGDNSRAVKMDEIIAAAKEANIHKFISSLPQGYSTNVGSKGTQLSGGQKQRIAIARALVRNPKILLLDEATSALDTESEKIVQEALDKARAGRTCVVIAHRLSTVQSADKICVVSEGRVTEAGTHQELMTLEGIYYKLVKKSQGQTVTASL